MQNVLVDRLVVVFMHQHRSRNARLQIRVICRPAEAQTKQRQHVFRQLQQFRHAFDVVTQPANIDAAKPQRFRRRERVLRHQRRIHHAQQQLFRQPQLGLGADLQMTVKIGAEHPELSRLGNVLLSARQRYQLLTHRRIGDADNGAALQKAGTGGASCAVDDCFPLRLGNRLIGEMANGTVGTKQVNGWRHFVSLCVA